MLFIIAQPALAAPGDLDTTFDEDGKIVTDFGYYAHVNALAVQADGKTVAAGFSSNEGGFSDFALVRYSSYGILDSSFGGDGKVTTSFSPYHDRINDVALQPDGKIVAVGFSEDVSSRVYNLALARYNADGSQDTTFDGDGVATNPIESGDDYAHDVTFQADGKVVVAGYSDAGGRTAFALARYNLDGSLDTGFSGDGKLTTTISGDDIATALAVQSNGRIVVAGSSMSNSSNSFALTRYYGSGDTVAPGPVDFRDATAKGAGVSLIWNNPTDADFDAVKVLRSASGYAASATDTVGQTKVYLGNASSYADDGLASGTYYYTAFAIDTSGNWSVAATASVVVDTTPPATTLASGPSGIMDTTSASFTFSSSEVGSTFQCKLDEGTFANCASPQHYDNLTNGTHTFRVRAVDAAGNADPTPVARPWTVDATPPKGTVLINGGTTSTRTRAVTLRLSASDPSPASGVTSMAFSNTGKYGSFTTSQRYATSKSWTLSSGAGTKTVYVQFRDRVGNVVLVRDTIKYIP